MYLIFICYMQDFTNSYMSEPSELSSLSPKYQEAYKTALREGTRTVCQSRVMIVGHSGAGKTSLVRCLLNQPFVEEHISTIGIDVGANIDIARATNWTLQTGN